MSNVTLHLGDCLEVMATLEANSADAIVTDPPAGIAMMNMHWDKDKGGRTAWIAWMTEIAAECLRLLKPGGHALVWALPRTSHWTATAWEDAGFELRDKLFHLFGSGFPKSLDVGKAIDKMRDDDKPAREVGAWLRSRREGAGFTQKQIAVHWPSVTGGLTGCVANWELGFNVPKWEQWIDLKRLIGFGDEMDAEIWRLNGRKGKPGDAWHEREVIGQRAGAQSDSTGRYGGWGNDDGTGNSIFDITAPATDAARQWDGWGSALKPSVEEWILLRKPLSEPTIADNVLAWGCGGLNIDGCRVTVTGKSNGFRNGNYTAKNDSRSSWEHRENGEPYRKEQHPQGRWPANLILDDDAAALLDEQSGISKSPSNPVKQGGHHRHDVGLNGHSRDGLGIGYADTGGASRYFKTVKYDKDDLCIPVSFAESNSSQPSRHVDFVLRLAAISVNLEETRSRDLTIRFINEMQNALRPNGVNDISTTLHTAQRYLQEFERMITEMLSVNPANSVEIQKLTSITTIIQSLWNTDGYAESAISPSTLNNLALGAKDLDGQLRFKYCAKASKRDRNSDGAVNNTHPTCKPQMLMRWLCKLICPPNGVVLDPFLGSGSTGVAAVLEGFSFIGIDKEAEYLEIARARIEHAASQIEPQLPLFEVV